MTCSVVRLRQRALRFGRRLDGAAAVLVDGVLCPRTSCSRLQVGGQTVETVEGLEGAEARCTSSSRRSWPPVRCSPAIRPGAMILAAKALLDANPDPSEAEIRDAFAVRRPDRESAYVKVVEAVDRAAAMLRGEPVEPFRPLVLTPLTNGKDAAPYEPVVPAPGVSFAVPRLVPSPDVPPMTVVGKPEIKVDALKLVKGHPAFSDDIELRGMLTAKVLRSPHAHARIVDIDDSEALALPGVRAVIHYKNTARIMYASGGQSWPNPLPWDQVSFDAQGPSRRRSGRGSGR